LAADLVGRKVAVIVTIGGDTAARAAKAATATLPVVFTVATDPVRSGLVSNLQRPGGNLTGNSGFQAELEPKRLGLLRELRPDATTIGVLVNPNAPYIDAQLNDIRSAAADIGQEIVILNASTIGEIDAAFATLRQKRVDALSVYRRRGADELWIECRRKLSAPGPLCRSHSQWRKTGRPADSTANEVRAGD
jgi:putative ABC transport system substrate-binding protein